MLRHDCRTSSDYRQRKLFTIAFLYQVLSQTVHGGTGNARCLQRRSAAQRCLAGIALRLLSVAGPGGRELN